MTNATAAQAYFAVRELEAQDKTNSSLVYTATFTEVVQKLLQGAPNVNTQVEAVIGIRLAQGAPDDAAAQSGDYLPNRVVQFGQHVQPAQDVLFATDGDSYVTSLSEFQQWTPRYNNTGYTRVPMWAAEVGDMITATCRRDGLTDNTYQAIFDDDSYASYGSWVGIHNVNNTWQFASGNLAVKVEGKPVLSGDIAPPVGQSFQIEITVILPINFCAIGASGDPSYLHLTQWNGVITNINFYDASTPSSSRWYPGVVTQDNQPGDGELVLQEVLSGVHNGTLTNFTTPVWTKV